MFSRPSYLASGHHIPISRQSCCQRQNKWENNKSKSINSNAIIICGAFTARPKQHFDGLLRNAIAFLDTFQYLNLNIL